MENNVWGWMLCADLKNCDPEKIRDEQTIRNFLVEICDLIKMTRYGEPVVVRFGDDPSVCGYSANQLIQESIISCHFIENIDSAVIDIFSCKEFDTNKAMQFCKEYWDAEESEFQFLERMIHCGKKRLKQ